MLALAASLFRILALVVLIDAVLSWVMPDPDRFPRKLTSAITEPLQAPIHAIVSPQATGGLDFSPLILIMLFNWLARFLQGMA